MVMQKAAALHELGGNARSLLILTTLAPLRGFYNLVTVLSLFTNICLIDKSISDLIWMQYGELVYFKMARLGVDWLFTPC